MTKCKFALQFIPLVTTFQFPLEVTQKYHHWQLCVLRVNSIAKKQLIAIASNGLLEISGTFIEVKVLTGYQLDQDCKYEHSPF